jgi:hypothetical protein
MGDLASFSSTYPDIPPQEAEFNNSYSLLLNKQINTTDVFQHNIDSLGSLIQSLQQYQTTIITNTPEYKDQTTAPLFLSNMTDTSVQTSTLQTKLDIVQANISNKKESIIPNAISEIINYSYMAGTIFFGILCILLTTYLVYTYMDSSVVSNSIPIKNARRNLS